MKQSQHNNLTIVQLFKIAWLYQQDTVYSNHIVQFYFLAKSFRNEKEESWNKSEDPVQHRI